MKIKIITTGVPKLSFAKSGFDEYIKRLGGFHKVEIVHLADSVKDEKIIEVIGNTFCVALDENGKEFNSRELAAFIDKKALHGVGEVCFVIGGPDGHGQVVLDRADYVWSMSKLTFPHDLAMLILAETLYRASSISAGHPYHRD